MSNLCSKIISVSHNYLVNAISATKFMKQNHHLNISIRSLMCNGLMWQKHKVFHVDNKKESDWPFDPIRKKRMLISSLPIFKESVYDHNIFKDEIKSILKVSYNETAYKAFFIHSCLVNRNLQLADSFIEYFRKDKEELNFVFLSNYLLLCSYHIEKVGDEKILELYKQITQIKYLPNEMWDMSIKSLARSSKYWPIAYRDLLHVSKYSDPSKRNGTQFNSSMNHLYAMVSQHIQDKHTIEVCSSLFRLGFTLQEETLVELINRINNMKKVHRAMEFNKLICVLHRSGSELSLKVAELLVHELSPIWNTKKVLINNGVCPQCNKKLKLVEMEPTDMKKLMDRFKIQGIEKEDIYQDSSPTEWKYFLSLLQSSSQPFTAVLDGLNFICKVKNAANQREILSPFLEGKTSRLLIIGRKHAKQKLKNIFVRGKVPHNVTLFLLNNSSKDDGYLIYAALYSGYGCKIITTDYLRNYIFVMEDGESEAVGNIFQKWTKIHQVFYTSKFLLPPYAYERIPNFDVSGNCWHIPYDPQLESFDKVKRKDYYWICVQMSQNTETMRTKYNLPTNIT